MYTVTYYSYKGGVGRTMALANTAYLLASAGKRVLVVDFDLEAPGLSTYEPFRCAHARPGIVEYVTEYIDTNIAPDVSNFVVECSYADTTIWLMPAGDFSCKEYNHRLQAIDWKNLYAERSGFLLMEDMKQQWEGFKGLGFDYVLIDSRTGHTDVGGICTRQLPDAVVIMFVPTPQNIDGLAPIVGSIVREEKPVRREKVRLHFCPSNVPDIDDEDEILAGLLAEAEKTLGYKEQAGLIQHYESLSLLQQPVFSAAHPRSRLARQYGELKTSVVAGNLRDRDGALTALGRMDDRYRRARGVNDEKALQAITNDAAQIRSTFPADVEVAWQLSILSATMFRPDEELAALDVVVEHDGDNKTFARLRRALVRATLGEREKALQDVEKLLLHEAVTIFEVSSAMDLMATLAPDQRRGIAERALQNDRMDDVGKAHLLELLLNDRSHSGSVVQLAKTASEKSHGGREILRNSYVLSLISDAQFEDAMKLIGSDRRQVIASTRIADVFNYSVAEWGATGSAPLDLMERVLSLSSRMRDVTGANELQCFALCEIALGRKDEALDDLKLARQKVAGGTRTFSCWRYLSVSSSEMVSDLEDMILIAETGAQIPAPGANGFRGARLS